jgi:hypothetical protein
MSLARWDGVVLDSSDPQRLSRFWSAVLGYEVIDDSPGWVELQNPSQPRPLFVCQGINAHVQHGAKSPQGNKFHLDLGSDDHATLTAQLEQLGARRVERIEAPGQPMHWIWADPEGNIFCAPAE